MPVNYALYENNLTSDPDDYMALVQPVGTATIDDVVDRIVQQGSTVTRADIYSVLEDYAQAIENLVREGYNVNTPTANYGASIKGVFEGTEDTFDESRHQLGATVNPGRRLRAAMRDAQPQKQEATTPRPNLVDYIDLNSETRNSALTPGGMGRLTGHRLKFDADDPAQGIFFVADDGSETRVTVLGRNKPSELMFMVPETLAAGDYTVQVRADVYGDSGEVREGTLDETLTVS